MNYFEIIILDNEDIEIIRFSYLKAIIDFKCYFDINWTSKIFYRDELRQKLNEQTVRYC